jgi:hypothetical protein
MALIDVTNALFKDKSNWNRISDDEKEKNFFIINRFMSKKFPEKSKLLNDKLINKVSAMDTWFIFMLSQPYPNWFWSKSETKKDKKFTEEEILYISKEFDIELKDIPIILKYYYQSIEDEIVFFRNAKKQNK